MIPILDNGHGGVINGVYTTKGKRSPQWEKGTLYEGVFNRWVVNRIIENLSRDNIPFYHASPELSDVSLFERVSRANKIYQTNPKVYLLSIHANAGGGTGIEGFTSKGITYSDNLCLKFLNNLSQQIPEMKMRGNKEADFYVLSKTACPALLLELGFMDNKQDYELLWSKNYIEKVALSISNTIKQLA